MDQIQRTDHDHKPLSLMSQPTNKQLTVDSMAYHEAKWKNAFLEKEQCETIAKANPSDELAVAAVKRARCEAYLFSIINIDRRQALCGQSGFVSAARRDEAWHEYRLAVDRENDAARVRFLHSKL